jgi:RNA polymerase sigma-70 factor (ECF subfamily)
MGALRCVLVKKNQDWKGRRGPGGGVFTVFTEYRNVLRDLITRRIRTGTDPEDILQETFTLVYEVEKKQPINHPKTYLYRTAANLVARENSRISNKLIHYMEDFEGCDLSSNEPTAFDHVAGRQELEALRRAIAALSPQCRKVFMLRKIHGLSHQEIAKELGISVSTTSKHLAKALERCDAYMRALNEAGADERQERSKKSNG